MSSKDEILTAIRQNTVQRYEYPDWEIKATVYPDKISRFYEISQFVGGKAVVLQEAEDINDIIRSHFPKARKIASQMEERSPVLPYVPTHWPRHKNWTVPTWRS